MSTVRALAVMTFSYHVILLSGMKTIYIKRATEDVADPITEENAKGRFDMFIDLSGDEEGGLVALAKQFGV